MEDKQEEKTYLDAFREAQEQEKKYHSSLNKAFEKILENSGVIITGLTMFAVVCLFSYQSAILSFLGLPLKYININIFIFASVFSLISYTMSCIWNIYAKYQADKILNLYFFRFDRFIAIASLLIIISWTVKLNNLLVIILVLFISLIAEWCLSRKWKKKRQSSFPSNKKLPNEKYKDTVAYYLSEFIDAEFKNVRLLANTIVIVGILCYGLGYYTISTQNKYEICAYNDDLQAIVFSQGDFVILNNVEIKKDELIIFKDSYTITNKDGLNIKYKEFNTITYETEKQ